MGGSLCWVVKEGFSKEGIFKQTFKYEKNLPCDDMVVGVMPSRKTSAQVLRRK